MSFETTITHNIMKYLNDMNGVIMEKVKGEAECVGRADINGCYHGTSMRIEVKTPDNQNKPSKIQLWDLWQWHNAGAIVSVVYSLDAVKQMIADIEDTSYTKNVRIIQEENNCQSVIIYPSFRGNFKFLYGMYYI